ncbi:MAG: hypothetical protein Q4F67_02510 [Propionibacteriaceae bacterium]|nr:hypothetical protein [Propionibacteriaceae bacterium]
MTPQLPAHVQSILDGDYGLEECFEIMRAARVKAVYRFRAEAEDSNADIASVVSAMMDPLNDLTNEIEIGLRQIEERITNA